MTQLHDLLGALRRVPYLPRARCTRRWRLFDQTIFEGNGKPPHDTLLARRIALAECAACAELEPCRKWLAQLPPQQRPSGVVAGRVIQRRTKESA